MKTTYNKPEAVKKYAIIAMIVTFIFAFTACGDKNATEEDTTVAVSEATAETTEAGVPEAKATENEVSENDAYTSACNHSWVEGTEVVHHDAIGHMETKETYVDSNGNDYGPAPEIVEHGGKECVVVESASADDEPQYIEVFCGEIAVFVEDKPAWDETVTTTKCSSCGVTK